MIYVLALLITAVAWGLRYFYDGPPWKEEKYCIEQGGTFKRGHLPVVRWTPDSDRYLAQGRGEAQCWPFHARVAVGWLCGGSTQWWHVVTAGSLILTGPALCWYARGSGLTETQSLAVVAAFSGLWGCFGLLTLCPVLVDAPAMLVSVLGAGAYVSGAGPWTLLVSSLLVGAIKETGPVWLALMAWHPVALVGLVVPAVRKFLVSHPLVEGPCVKCAHNAPEHRMARWSLGGRGLFRVVSQFWQKAQESLCHSYDDRQGYSWQGSRITGLWRLGSKEAPEQKTGLDNHNRRVYGNRLDDDSVSIAGREKAGEDPANNLGLERNPNEQRCYCCEVEVPRAELPDIIKHPIKAASMYRRGSLTDGWTMVAPWGIGIASLLTPTPQLWCAVGVAYLQPLIASDVTRLVQNIAPIVLIHAVAAVPESYLPLALVLHLFNPWQKTEFERQPVRLQGIQ